MDFLCFFVSNIFLFIWRTSSWQQEEIINIKLHMIWSIHVKNWGKFSFDVFIIIILIALILVTPGLMLCSPKSICWMDERRLWSQEGARFKNGIVCDDKCFLLKKCCNYNSVRILFVTCLPTLLITSQATTETSEPSFEQPRVFCMQLMNLVLWLPILRWIVWLHVVLCNSRELLSTNWRKHSFPFYQSRLSWSHFSRQWSCVSHTSLWRHFSSYMLRPCSWLYCSWKSWGVRVIWRRNWLAIEWLFTKNRLNRSAG